ncbi:uncharacterized protein LOC102160973 [Sus scrofa]|uniref:uncharacterized protein LOC102160973 n=1 Tax=Sus scrofa TaxID=9823 RepID=UPI000A2B3153|nr:uncharacterized protein LOC102160973 [Sus scrofa]XP_020931605.1 uncharacterized protein LOC102160973 [Sus scrofa]XP_020931606.1 uncharacterized protein LOC102160973 [Sus scrofa]
MVTGGWGVLPRAPEPLMGTWGPRHLRTHSGVTRGPPRAPRTKDALRHRDGPRWPPSGSDSGPPCLKVCTGHRPPQLPVPMVTLETSLPGAQGHGRCREHLSGAVFPHNWWEACALARALSWAGLSPAVQSRGQCLQKGPRGCPPSPPQGSNEAESLGLAPDLLVLGQPSQRLSPGPWADTWCTPGPGRHRGGGRSHSRDRALSPGDTFWDPASFRIRTLSGWTRRHSACPADTPVLPTLGVRGQSQRPGRGWRRQGLGGLLGTAGGWWVGNGKGGGAQRLQQGSPYQPVPGHLAVVTSSTCRALELSHTRHPQADGRLPAVRPVSRAGRGFSSLPSLQPRPRAGLQTARA